MSIPVIQTYTGKRVNPLDLQPDDICIEDIAHALALCNRFAGHTKEPISVAQHSVYVAGLCNLDAQTKLWFLLHDASEAYLGDVTKWVKATPAMAAYREAESRAQQIIIQVFLGNWSPNLHQEALLDWADRVMVRFEGGIGCGETFKIDHPRYPPLSPQEEAAIRAIQDPWCYWPWSEAERRFLTLFRELTCVA